MARNPRDTSIDLESDDDVPSSERSTPVRGMPTNPIGNVERKVRDIEERLRDVEELRAILAGIPGHPGILESLRSEMGALGQRMTSSDNAHNDRHRQHDDRILKIEMAAWRLGALIGACSIAGGFAATLVSRFIMK